MQPEDFRDRAGVSETVFQQLQTYHKALHKWQKAINLVSNKTLQEAWMRHFWDSAQLQPHIPETAHTIADLGSGAGFPGMVLALLFPDKDIHMVESDERKCQFLKNVSRETIRSVSIHNERVEDVMQNLMPDLITARAFSSLENIMTMTRPAWLKNKNLEMILLKGQKSLEEIAEAEKRYRFQYELLPSQSHDTGHILKIAHMKDAG